MSSICRNLVTKVVARLPLSLVPPPTLRPPFLPYRTHLLLAQRIKVLIAFSVKVIFDEGVPLVDHRSIACLPLKIAKINAVLSNFERTSP